MPDGNKTNLQNVKLITFTLVFFRLALLGGWGNSIINVLKKSCFIQQMVNAIACIIELWYTQEVAKHERSVRVARGDSRVRL